MKNEQLFLLGGNRNDSKINSILNKFGPLHAELSLIRGTFRDTIAIDPFIEIDEHILERLPQSATIVVTRKGIIALMTTKEEWCKDKATQ